MQTIKKVVIAEDHNLFREGVKAMLAVRADLSLIGEANDGLAALEIVKKEMPDLLIIDLSMPHMSGIRVIKEAKLIHPDIIILALTMHQSDQYVIKAFEAGANGYCIKDTTLQELMSAINNVLNKKNYISPKIADSVMEGMLEGRKRLKTRSSWDTITPREREVLKLLAEGSLNKDIANLLNISIKTVEKHRANIIAKLDLHSVASLTAFAIEQGLAHKSA